MIVTQDFVFIHTHKSGGTFVTEFIERFSTNVMHIGYHYPLKMLPSEFQKLPILAFVRNPLAYYVSWYSFQKQKSAPNGLFRAVSNEGTLSFKDTISNLVTLCKNPKLLNSVLNLLPVSYVGYGINIPRAEMAGIANSNVGFYSYIFDHLTSSDFQKSLFIGRTERLRHDLTLFFEAYKISLTSDMLSFIQNTAPRNISLHAGVLEHYDVELLDLIAQFDGTLMKRFGYRLDDHC